MTRLVFELLLPGVPPERLRAFHASAEALTVLTPPEQQATPLTDDLEVRNGALHVFSVRPLPFLRVVWRARISEVTEEGFVDTAESSPFAAWRHRHRFLSDGAGGSVLRDELEYVPPFGWAGQIANFLFLRRQIHSLFTYRHTKTTEFMTMPQDSIHERPRKPE